MRCSACDNGSPNDPDPDWPPQGTLVSGNLQQATVGAELPQPIVVRVTDQDGDPIPGLSITFAVTAGGGTLFAATAQTNASGEASNRWTLGTVAADTQRVEARVIDPESGQPVVLATFLAIGRADVPASITARPPAARTGSAGQPLVVVIIFARQRQFRELGIELVVGRRPLRQLSAIRGVEWDLRRPRER